MAPRERHSQFLAQAGYTEQHADRLARDIRLQLLTLEAEFEETTEYGEMYGIVGSLIGPNGRMLRVASIWMTESATGQTKFITLYPAKGRLRMSHQQFTRVALKENLHAHGLQRGDVATIVETYPGGEGQEQGYSLEVFNLIGETIVVVAVRESQIEPLAPDEVLHVGRLNEVLV